MGSAEAVDTEYIPALQKAMGIMNGLNPDGHKDRSKRDISLLDSKKLGFDTKKKGKCDNIF